MFYRENVYLAGAKAEGNRSDRFHWPATFGNRKQMSTRYRNLADYKSREREKWREGGMGFFAMGRNDRSFRVLGGGGGLAIPQRVDCKTTESNLISGIRQTNGGDCRDNVKYRLT